uniref:amidase domain-containing protein n=1 Tax=Bacillus sp. DX2.2 TaxID=3073452 RepID=UPI00402AEF91
MKLNKLLVGAALSLGLIFSQMSVTSAEEKKADDYTLGEIESVLFDYFREHNLSFKVNSEEFQAYLFNQLMYHKDKELEKHLQYDQILGYAAEYLHEKSLYAASTADTSKTQSLTAKSNPKEFSMKPVAQKTIGQIKEEVQTEEAAAKIEQVNRAPKMAAARSGYSGSAAASYAVKWAKGRNPNFGDYSGGIFGGGGDCTNFVSQAVNAGGKGMNKLNNISFSTADLLPGNTYWYSVVVPNATGNRSVFKASHTWTVVENFYNYWSSRVPTYETYSPKALEGNANVGDVIQYRNDETGRKWHSLMVTHKSPGSFQISQHSGDRKNDEIGYILDSDPKVKKSKLLILQFTRS